MSSRVLKKLQKEPDIAEPDQDGESDEMETNSWRIPNRFDLLNQQQSLSESEFKEDDNETENLSAANNTSEKIKKKRRKKRKSNKHHFTRSSEDNADAEEDEIIKTAKLVDKMFGPSGSSYDRTATPDLDLAQAIPIKGLLSVQHKNLNPQNEMKRIFGSKVVTAEQQKRRNPRTGAIRTLKSTWLVNPKENWPPVNKTGIYMNLVQQLEEQTAAAAAPKKSSNDKNVLYFAFEHSPTYRQIQQKFLVAVESMNSDNIIQIINQQPYHVDALIQMSELCKMSEDHATAAELIEHALFALESSFHSMFSLTQGNSRLDYRRQENRSFFIVLFKHSQYLEGRACSRTALEIVKLILTLDPSDPLAIILIIDYYALRSKQYEFLIQLYREWEASHNLSQLPNMAYSYALALFQSKQSGADDALQYALMMFPGVLKQLLDSLSIQPDPRVNSHKYFGANSFSGQPLALQQLTALYVCRAKGVWCDPVILPWLEKNAHIVLDKVDSKDEIISEYTSKRNQRYVNPPRTILRHIILSDYKEKVPIAFFLKKETDPIVHYDPLPPLDSINTYTRPKVTQSARLLQGSAVSMFFQSLLPSFNMQTPQVQQPQPNRAAADAAEEGNARGGGVALIPMPENEGAVGGDPIDLQAEYRNTLNSIVEAMRNFLSDIRRNDGDLENDSSDDDPNNYLT